MSEFANSRYPMLVFSMSDPAFPRISIIVFPLSFSRIRDFRIRIFAVADSAISRFLVFRSRDLWLYFCSRSREFAISRDQNPRFRDSSSAIAQFRFPGFANPDPAIPHYRIQQCRSSGPAISPLQIPRFRDSTPANSQFQIARIRQSRLHVFAISRFLDFTNASATALCGPDPPTTFPPCTFLILGALLVAFPPP